MYWYLGVRVEAHGPRDSGGQDSVSIFRRTPGRSRDRPSSGYAASGAIPAASRIVGVRSMLATGEAWVAPASTSPGHRIRNGILMASVYGRSFPRRPCSDQKKPLSERKNARVF